MELLFLKANGYLDVAEFGVQVAQLFDEIVGQAELLERRERRQTGQSGQPVVADVEPPQLRRQRRQRRVHRLDRVPRHVQRRQSPPDERTAHLNRRPATVFFSVHWLTLTGFEHCSYLFSVFYRV